MEGHQSAAHITLAHARFLGKRLDRQTIARLDQLK
jgi:hypothetical protein